MLNRRDFIQGAALTLPIVGSSACAKVAGPQEPAIGDFSPEQTAAVRKEAAQFENALNTVRKADVPYSVAPRFCPPV